MNVEDDNDAAWHQQEMDERRYRELLASDPGYLNWLATLEHLRKDSYEISSESYL